MSDKSLHAIATEKPTTIEAFGAIFGIGEHKRNAYGQRFISFISDYLASSASMPHQPVPSYMTRQKQMHAKAYAEWTAEEDARLKILHSKGTTVERLMDIFARNKGAILNRLRKLGK